MTTNRIFLKGLSVNNFRGINELDTNNFGTINLITGKNNSGKTSLLEAIFLSAAPCNPALLFQLNARRGLARVSPKQSTVSYFYNELKPSSHITITAKPKLQTQYTLKITEKGADETAITEFSEDSSSIPSHDSIVVEFEYHKSGQSKYISKAIVTQGNIKLKGTKDIHPTTVYVSAGYRFDHNTQAERYSDLDKADLIPMYERLLGIFEENIKRTSLVVQNEETIIHVDVGFGLMPISLLGSGIARFSAMILAIASAKDGIVLIDEVENAFHHSCLEKMWLALSELAETSNCQIFTATHSDECINAAINIFQDKPDADFRLHRMEKDRQKTTLHTFEIDELVTLSENDWDLR